MLIVDNTMRNNMLMRMGTGMGFPGRTPESRDYRVDISTLKDVTPTRAGRTVTTIPGTKALLSIPRAYIPLCKFHISAPHVNVPKLYLVYYCCAVEGVNTYAWIRHKLAKASQFDAVDVVFQCRGVVPKADATVIIEEIVANSGHPNVTTSVYDDEPISTKITTYVDDDCGVPLRECSCHDNHAGEYRGIAKAHEVASKCHDQDVVTYWHSKGVSRFSSLEAYLEAEQKSPGELISTFENIRQMFTVLPNLALWSCFVGERSRPIPWFNMWSTRARRLKALPPPVKTAKRHYYETYLGSLPLQPHEITISPSPVNQNGYLHYILEVGFQCVRPDSWHRR